jgi:hypothetical protein
MKAFLVHVNGERVCLAGVDDGVLSAIVDWVGGTTLDRKPRTEQFKMTVGGLESKSREHLLWDSRKLQVGDSVTITIVETDSVDPETKRYRGDDLPDEGDEDDI